MTPLASCLVVLGLVAGGSTALAQDAGGHITGRVVNSAGSPVSDQRVLLRAEPQVMQRVSTTDAGGRFGFSGLEPGGFTVAVTVDGRVVAQRTITLGGPGEASPDVLLTLPPVWLPSRYRVSTLPRTSAAQLVGTGGVPQTFSDLAAVLEPGHQVKMNGERVTVATVSSEQITVIRRHWLRTEQKVLTGDLVRRLDVVDSTRDGSLWGLAVGGALGAAVAIGNVRRSHEDEDCTLCVVGVAAGIALPGVGAVLGGAIDGGMTDRIYERRERPVALGVERLRGRRGIVLSARLTW